MLGEEADQQDAFQCKQHEGLLALWGGCHIIRHGSNKQVFSADSEGGDQKGLKDSRPAG